MSSSDRSKLFNPGIDIEVDSIKIKIFHNKERSGIDHVSKRFKERDSAQGHYSLGSVLDSHYKEEHSDENYDDLLSDIFEKLIDNSNEDDFLIKPGFYAIYSEGRENMVLMRVGIYREDVDNKRRENINRFIAHIMTYEPINDMDDFYFQRISWNGERKDTGRYMIESLNTKYGIDFIFVKI